MSATMTVKRATLTDLRKVKEKAELVEGRIIRFMPTGHLPNVVAGRIYRMLAEFVETYLKGVVYTDNMGFIVKELDSGRESFSPDVAYFNGTLPKNPMRFVDGTPTFAVEVRSEHDYTPAAEREIMAKRVDYFAAGTLAVWDVDPIQKVIRLFVNDAQQPVATFGLNDQAHAEPAVPGWTLDVGRLFA